MDIDLKATFPLRSAKFTSSIPPMARSFSQQKKMIRLFQIMDSLPSGLDQHVSVG
jgi:hypothetical protein